MADARQMMIAQLREQFGDKIALTDAADVAPWLTDWRGRWTGKSDALLQPASTQELSALVRLANEHGVPLVPQGGNTSMVGGATPPEDGTALIVSMRRMNKIRELDAAARFAIAEAGVILETLHEAAHARRLRFPLTLGAKGSATIGGLVSTNAGGTQVLKFGPMRGLVEGIEAVLPDGLIHDGLVGLKKDNRGPSIDQMLIGAEGTMGFITAARLKLVPLPDARATAWVGVADPATALKLLRMVDTATDQVEGFELIPDDSLRAAEQHMSLRSPLEERHGWYVLIEATQAEGQDDPRALLEGLLAKALEGGLIADATIAANEAQSEAMWHLRDHLSISEKTVYGAATQHDISVPVDAIPAFLDEVKHKVEAEWPGTDVSGYGHMGDGNIHLHVRAGERGSDGWVDGEGKEISRMVHDLVAACGGSISAEHGIGQMKRDEFERLSPARAAAVRALKAGIDPKGLMNPGKLV